VTTFKRVTLNLDRGYLYVLLSALIFSTMEPVAKMVAGKMDAMSLVLIRFAIGGLFLLPFALHDAKRKEAKLTCWDFLCIVFLSCLFIASNILMQIAVTYIKASSAAVLFSVNPVFTMPLAAIILRERFDNRAIVPLLLSFAGVYSFLSQAGVDHSLQGVLITLFAALLFSLYSVFSKRSLTKFGGITLTCYSFLIGCSILALYMLLSGFNVMSGFSLSIFPHLLYLGIVVASLGYLIYFTAMEKTSAITASTAFFLKIALAPIFSFLILGERMSVRAIVGMLLVMGGSAGMLYIRMVEQS